MKNTVSIVALFDLARTQAKEYLRAFEYPWQALAGLNGYILSLGEKSSKSEYLEIAPKIWVHRSAKISPTAALNSPCIVGANTEIRHGAFIRGGVLVGEDCVVGNSVELKNAILFDGVQVPHYNYVGDSILGHKAHMGAGAVTSNVKSDKTPVVIKGEQNFATDRKKVGAFVGDFVEVGCNSVLNPGTVVGRNTHIYPLSCVRGVIPANSIYKNQERIIERE